MSLSKNKNTKLPTVSIIIITWNVERTIEKVLDTIEMQDYPKNLIEIIAVDGNSTDRTLNILKSRKQKVKVVQSPYPRDPEACRGVGLEHARGEIIAFIDSDNYLPNKKWLSRMIEPFLENEEIVGSQPWRFAYLKKDSYIHRYFALLGSADPVGLYLKKADKISYLSNEWHYGEVITQNNNYLIVEFNTHNFPTLGSNGFLARKKLLLKAKSDPEHYFHIDVPFDLCMMGFCKYAVVKEDIIHDTATDLFSFIWKRGRYMRLHYQKRSKDRRYKVFDPQRKEDVYRLLLFIVFSTTIAQPLYVATKGFIKKPDFAWFIHPIFCFLITITYGFSILSRVASFKKIR